MKKISKYITLSDVAQFTGWALLFIFAMKGFIILLEMDILLGFMSYVFIIYAVSKNHFVCKNKKELNK